MRLSDLTKVGQSGIPYNCVHFVHCVMNEVLSMEWGGHPLWVTGYDPDPQKPCSWNCKKRREIFLRNISRCVGRQKPSEGEGKY